MWVYVGGMNTTPKDMLTLYRREMDDFSLDQCKQLTRMPLADRIELLFLMLMCTSKMVQRIHNLIQPGAAETSDMPEPDRTN
jgi:hypothetical protein